MIKNGFILASLIFYRRELRLFIKNGFILIKLFFQRRELSLKFLNVLGLLLNYFKMNLTCLFLVCNRCDMMVIYLVEFVNCLTFY